MNKRRGTWARDIHTSKENLLVPEEFEIANSTLVLQYEMYHQKITSKQHQKDIKLVEHR